jgi:hypothetical protein
MSRSVTKGRFLRPVVLAAFDVSRSGWSKPRPFRPFMHDTDDREDRFTLFAGVRNANRILDFLSPRLWSLVQASKALSIPLILSDLMIEFRRR